MSDVECLIRLFRAFSERDDAAFYRAAESLISEELAANHHSLAHDLKQALGSPPARRNQRPSGNGLAALPRDRRSGAQLVLFQDRSVDTSKLILPEKTRKQINRVIEEWRHRLKLARSGYQPRSRLLFWGPPGCGKTLTAYYLADQLNLPVGLVQLSAVISSFLGDTASHLQRVFEMVAQQPIVLLLDEIDAIGKNRDDPNDVGELKRVVNGFLQAMDGLGTSESLLIGASNHQYLLDPAIWRRFDDVVYFPNPGASDREEFARMQLTGIQYKGSLRSLGKKLSGLSFAEIERILVEAVKTVILADRTELLLADVHEQLRRIRGTAQAAERNLRKRHGE